MQYTVISGEFKTSVDTSTPRQAAEEAFNLWKMKINKPNLAKITMVVKKTHPDNSFYFCTNTVLDTL